ncbi:ead/Ea22-like family protein [Klebsiella pneumoniae]|uniref:ead/Ea22-like family protein n=1 Tax=Klebsiella pneumoniae TaxID=573 RepID=UPI0020165B5C|nr:ead/Ea22-like family protein [Klebsiella pneumoniae]
MTDITELAQSLKAAADREMICRDVAETSEIWERTVTPENILALVEALEYYKSREERVTSLVRDNSKSWDELYRQVEAKGKRNVELVEALASEKRICATWRKTAEANSEKLEKAQQQMTESENRVRKQNRHICELFDDNTALCQRIAELESRTVTFKLPFTPEPSAFAPWVAKAFYQFHKDTVKSCVAIFSDACAAAGIKVEAE